VLQYNYFRDYDPSTGRYVESDPIGYLLHKHLFVYAASSPTMLSDQFGLDEKFSECLRQAEVSPNPNALLQCLLQNPKPGEVKRCCAQPLLSNCINDANKPSVDYPFNTKEGFLLDYIVTTYLKRRDCYKKYCSNGSNKACNSCKLLDGYESCNCEFY